MLILPVFRVTFSSTTRFNKQIWSEYGYQNNHHVNYTLITQSEELKVRWDEREHCVYTFYNDAPTTFLTNASPQCMQPCWFLTNHCIYERQKSRI